MNRSDVTPVLPPVIRVFLSSTFADMEHERTYFNETLAPQFSRLCAQRGVSFFSVDLRWGITEEEQVNGEVLPICLREIDRCRPFFIGILGDRYGSLLEQVSPSITDSIPWLKGKEGKSVTELEMLYATLEHEQDRDAKNAAFFLRSDALSHQWYGPSEPSAPLLALKQQIREDPDVAFADYSSLDEFGAVLTKIFAQWLDQEFPLSENMEEIRRSWYNGELRRNYLPDQRMHAFLDTYLGQSSRPLLLYGDGQRGKTAFLTNWKPADGHKILVNCGCDDTFLYWPSVAQEIIKQLHALQPDRGAPDIDVKASLGFALLDSAASRKDPDGAEDEHQNSENFFLVTDSDRENFRQNFVAWLSSLSLSEPVCIVINDLNLLQDSSSRFLAWLPNRLPEKLRLICSSNSQAMQQNAETLGWNCKEMPTFPAGKAREFLLHYLQIYGKSLSPSQLDTLFLSPITAYPGQLRFLADFLIEHGRFHNLDRFIRDLSTQQDPQSMYRYIFAHITSGFSTQETLAVRTVFGLLKNARMALSEQECFYLCEGFTSVTAMEWANIRSVFEHFHLIKGDYWTMRDEEVEKFTDSLLEAGEDAAIHAALGNYMTKRLHDHHEGRQTAQVIREKTEFSKAALIHFRQAGNMRLLWETLTEDIVLRYLSKLDWQVARAAWMTLVLQSEVNVPSVLFQLLRRYSTNGEDARLIHLRIEQLFSDLSLTAQQEKLQQLLGRKHTAGGFTPEFAKDSTFPDTYNHMCELKDNADFKGLLRFTEDLLSSDGNRTALEQCSVYFFKTDAESHLGLYKEALGSANTYYTYALLASSVHDLQRSVGMRGDAYYRLGHYEDAEQCQKQTAALAVEQGDLRGYLAARNIIAMCQYRAEQFEESIRNFDELYFFWRKLGDLREAASVRMNKCNALFLSGDAKKALEESEKLYQSFSSDSTDPLIPQLRLSVLGNMGRYAVELKDYAKAETYLLQSVEEAERIGADTTRYSTLNALVDLYKSTDRFLQAAEISEKMMEFLWERKDYQLLMKMLNDATNLLSANFYHDAANTLKTRWEGRFSQLPGGKEFFHKGLGNAVSDENRVDVLREQIALAKSEGDGPKTARTLVALAAATLPHDRRGGVKHLLEAAALFDKAGIPMERDDALAEAAIHLFENGKTADEALYQDTLPHITDPTMLRILSLWRQLGGEAPQEVQRSSFFNRLMGKQQQAAVPPSNAELLLSVSSCAQEQTKLALACLTSFPETIAKECTTEEITRIIRDLPEKASKTFIFRLMHHMTNDSNPIIGALTKDYTSPTAEKRLAYYEKLLDIAQLEEARGVDDERTAALAGNLAIIYRRRKEKEKTLRCHQFALQLFEQCGKDHDACIELLNLATAYSQFGEKDKAASLLRDGMKKAKALQVPRMEASMAGNLASLLSSLHDASLDEEILRCYEIEEQFFRSAGIHRDLAISLFHQVAFYAEKGGEYAERWPAKLRELEEIAAKYNFPDIASAVASLKGALQRNTTAPAKPSADEEQAARTYIEQILALDPPHKLAEFSLENDGCYYAFCLSKEEVKIERENMLLYLRIGSMISLRVVLLAQPTLRGKENNVMTEYAAWWNARQSYSLRWDSEKHVLQTIANFENSDFSRILSGCRKLLKLWQADKSCMQISALGIADAAMLQEMKTKIMEAEKE